jgi:hypothetical protein
MGDLPGLSSGRMMLGRRVHYIPSGENADRFGHQIDDMQFTVANPDMIANGEATDEYLREVGDGLRRAIQTEKSLGLTKPTEETFEFMMSALVCGEEATRPGV